MFQRSLSVKLLTLCLRLYRRISRIVSPPACRYYPSCSEYAIQALEKKGFLRGIPLIFKRLTRCNALFPGGYDPVK